MNNLSHHLSETDCQFLTLVKTVEQERNQIIAAVVIMGEFKEMMMNAERKSLPIIKQLIGKKNQTAEALIVVLLLK